MSQTVTLPVDHRLTTLNSQADFFCDTTMTV